MRKAAEILCATLVAILSTSAFAQGKPNFAGTWVREMPAGASTPASGGWGLEPTITQTATSITINWLAGRDGAGQNIYITRTYHLTGDSQNPVLGRGGVSTGEFNYTVSTWKDAKLVLTTGQITEVISVEDGKLVIERTAPVRGGGAAPTTSKIVYRKKT